MSRTLLTLLCASTLGLSPLPDDSPVEAARTLLADDDRAGAAAVLEDALARGRGSFEVRALLGETLLELDRVDEAAHYLETAFFEAVDKDDQKKLRRLVRKADPHFERREGFFENVAERLARVAAELAENGHDQRALELAVRIEPIARGDNLVEVQALLAELRAARTAVDLDDAASDELAPGEWPVHTLESDHYIVRANLEPEVCELVASTMDDIFGYYIQIYFEGDEDRVQKRKATIRIHPTSEAMLATWEGDSTPGGWWSPSEWTVVCYDTRTTSGSLDYMLETLFHEASHQFMTMRERGGSSPSWLNEGTATFFEGAKAMADGRVMWPQAARGRLFSLSGMLQSGEGPSLADVLGYAEPGSYDPIYYPFGWGIVYFLQQFEDPETLEFVYREPYQEYMERITTTAANTRELFDELFLGKASPQGFETLAEFEAFWSQWIVESVLPLYSGDEREARRRALVARYMEAAGPRPRRKPKKSERARIDDLLVRALGHVEYLREELSGGSGSNGTDGGEKLDGPLLETSIEILERLERPEAAAPAIEALLDLVDAGQWELDEETYETYAERLRELDAKNAALREARGRSSSFARSAQRLLDAYLDDDDPFLLRAYTFARLAGLALEDERGLLPASLELRERARDAGLLLGTIRDVVAPADEWVTIFDDAENTLSFDTGPEQTSIEGVRPVARICTAVPIRGEYEIRATLVRHPPLRRATVHGVVVSGTPDGDWIVVGLDGRGNLSVRRMEFGDRGAVVDRALKGAPRLPAPIPDDESPTLVVHAFPEGRLVITIGERDPIELQLEKPLPATAFAGLYAKDGKVEARGLLAEIYP